VITLVATTDGVIVPLRVRASARRNGLAGEHDGALRVDVTAARENGKANRAVIKVMSEILDVAASKISIASGATSPIKRLLVSGAMIEAVRARIHASLESI
jgi:uncharacterized protein (TIGR00251 family)